MTEKEILKELKAGNTKPIYFLTGDEPHGIDVISDYLEKNILDESERDFNLTVLYGGDTTMADVLNAAKRFPMMSEKSVVIVKEAQAMKDWKSKDKIEPLIQYLESPQESTVLAFLHKHKSLDGRSQVAKVMKKNSVFFESKKVREDRIPSWISSYIREKNRKIDEQTCALLAEYLGNDLGKVVNALDKLCILVNENEQITTLHVERNIGISKDYNVFEFQKALGKKDVLKSNQIINYFSSNPKNHPIQMILPALYNFFTKLIKLHRLPAGANAAKVLGVNPYFLDDYRVAKKHYSAGSLARVIGHLRIADMKSKGVQNVSTSHADILKELTYKILHDPR
jgi:DNA polymerase-3 subunit delta